MTIADGLRTTRLSEAASQVALAFAAEPPGWTRLEPQSVSGDPTPGLEARVHDPMWLLSRQWQLGEFHGEDVGSPVSVALSTTTSDIAAYQAGPPSGDGSGPVHAWLPGDLLEPVVEAEPAGARTLGLSHYAEAAAQLLTELAEAGVDSTAAQPMIDACPLTLQWDDPHDGAGAGWAALVAGRLPDPEKVSAGMGLDTATPTAAPWFDARADADAVLGVIRSWHAWYRAAIAPLPRTGDDAWTTELLEHRFSLEVSTTSGPTVLRSPRFAGGRADWYCVDADPSAAGLDGPPPAAVSTRSATVLATPLRFAGMPAERYWQFEDGQVNLGALPAQPHDLARLALVEFALVYGNDWLVVPVDTPYGSFVSVDSVTVTTTFGETLTVDAADDSARPGRFTMFGTSVAGTHSVVPGLLLPPACPAVLDGDAREEVLFLRDEIANMAWAVERRVTGPSGLVRARTDEPRPPQAAALTDPGADLDYLLETEVPEWWIPLVPVSTGYGTLALRKGAMVKNGCAVLPVGVLLEPGRSVTVQDEAVPREGVRVRRVPQLARRADGSYVRWISRRVSVGRGEGASGLAFDSAIRRPAPP